MENIVRHLRMGKSPLDAATDASNGIGLAVIATTFSLVAVFLPTAFMGGIAGKFFRQFGVTAAVVVLASLMVARLLTPMMAAHRLRQATINAELGGRSIGEVMAEANLLPSLKSLPSGVTQMASGEAERMGELFGSFGLAMVAGILCIYVVLVLLFHDFLQPATILAALPLSVGGAFLALLITGASFSLSSIMVLSDPYEENPL